MIVKCPYCGKEDDYEIFDTCGGDGEDYIELCTCFECDETFEIHYRFESIMKADQSAFARAPIVKKITYEKGLTRGVRYGNIQIQRKE